MFQGLVLYIRDHVCTQVQNNLSLITRNKDKIKVKDELISFLKGPKLISSIARRLIKKISNFLQIRLIILKTDVKMVI